MRFSYLGCTGIFLFILMQFQNIRQHDPLIITFHDLINKSMLQKKLRFLESFWKLLADSLLDDSRTGKTDESFRLCQNDISQHSKACSYTTCCRICENRYIEKSCIAVLTKCHTCFCHLHQGYKSLLHSGTAGADVEDHWKLFFCGTLKHTGDFFSYYFSHTGHHETAVADT